MGVCYWIVCNQCKEYIDIDKATEVSHLSSMPRPPQSNTKTYLKGGYWDSRAMWFLFKHAGHEVKIRNDHDDSWYDDSPYLTEVFPYHKERV